MSRKIFGKKYLDFISFWDYHFAMLTELRNAEVKAFRKKIDVFIAKKLKFMLDVENWQGVELHRKYGFPSNRQSELMNPEKYLGPIVSDDLLAILLGGNFVTTEQIKKDAGLTEKELDYFNENFGFYGNKELRQEIIRLLRAGEDPEKVLRNYRLEKGIPD